MNFHKIYKRKKIVRICTFIVISQIIIPLKCYNQKFVPNSNEKFGSLSTKQGLSQSTVFSIAQDKYGFIWLGTRDGINRYDGYNFLQFKNNPHDTSSLSNNEITFIYIDFKGDVWIGTQGGGLNQYVYNENRFIRYSNLGYENLIKTIFQTKDSAYWIGTTEGLLRGEKNKKNNKYQFINESKKAIYYNENHEIIPLNRTIISTGAIIELSKDTLLVGTNNGVFVYYRKDKKFERVNLDVINAEYITSIIAEKPGIYLISTFNGLVKLSVIKKNRLTFSYKLWNSSQEGKYRITTNRIEDIVIDKEGNKWIGTRGGGLLKFLPDETIKEYTHNINTSNSITDNIINSLFIDKNDLLWIGTESKGCSLLELKRIKFFTIRNINEESTNKRTGGLVTAITGAKNNGIWMGSPVNGIVNLKINEKGYFRYDRVVQIPTSQPGVATSDIQSLMYTDRNELWIGSATNDLIKYKGNKQFDIYPVNGYIFALHQDNDENVWFGTWGQGLGLINSGTNEIITFSNQSNQDYTLSSDKVLAIFNDTEGNLWVGTKGGGINVAPLNILKQKRNYFVSFKHKEGDVNSISHNDIFCIHQDIQGNIWIGTGGGLNRVVIPDNKNTTDAVLKKEINFKSYLDNNKLSGSIIYGILEDKDGNLWLSTINGISVFNKKTERFTNYNESYGLQDNEFYYNAFYKDDRGYFYFGGVNGMTYFHPDSIKQKEISANVSITGLKIFNKEVKPGEKVNGRIILRNIINNVKEITLSYKDKEFTLEFSAMLFANSNAINYEYRLLNFNNIWQETGVGKHSATYTNLDNGEYIFQIKNIGSSSEDDIAQLKILITPPLWRRPFFYFIYTLLIVFMLAIFRKYSLIGVKEKNKLIIEHLENQKQHELTEAKMKFFTNISHEIRTPLTLISDPLNEVLKRNDLDNQLNKDLKLVAKNVKRLLNLANQLLQFRKIDLGIVKLKKSLFNLNSFLEEMIGFFEQHAEKHEIVLLFNMSKENFNIEVDKELMVTVFYNLLSNAIKYSLDGSIIEIDIKLTQKETFQRGRFFKNFYIKKEIKKYLAICIQDNGQGIPKSELPRIFDRFYQPESSFSRNKGSGIGLAMVKEYVELHNGIVEVESEEGIGSKFTVLLPFNEKIQGVIPEISEQINVENIINWQAEDDTLKNEYKIEEAGITDEKEYIPSVLLIEDDDELSGYISDKLNNKFRITVAHQGGDGFKLAKKIIPDIIISDIMLPDNDGLEICRLLKNSFETSHIPVILLTAKSADENIVEGFKHGADLYMTKPFNIKVLQSQIDALIEARNKLKNIYSRQITVGPNDVSVTSMDEKFLNELAKITEENVENPDFDVKSLVNEMHMSHATILRKVKAITGLSLVDYLKNYRLQKACLILQKEKFPVNEVSYMVGFSDSKYFSKCFQKEFGKSPTEYMKDYHKI